MIRIAVFASGRGSNFKNLITSDIPDSCIALLITDRHCAALSIAREYAIEAKTFLPAAYPTRLDREVAIAQALEAYDIHRIVLAGYMRLLSPWFVHRFNGKIINIHPSLLPLYKGTQAIEQAFADGKKLYGVTVHLVNEEMDAGAVIAQRQIHYNGEDIQELERLVHETEYDLYPQVIREWCRKGIKS